MKTPKELAAIVISAKPKDGPSDLESCMEDFLSSVESKDAKGMAQAFEAAMSAGPMDSSSDEAA
jgi:hypothetical protein